MQPSGSGHRLPPMNLPLMQDPSGPGFVPIYISGNGPGPPPIDAMRAQSASTSSSSISSLQDLRVPLPSTSRPSSHESSISLGTPALTPDAATTQPLANLEGPYAAWTAGTPLAMIQTGQSHLSTASKPATSTYIPSNIPANLSSTSVGGLPDDAIPPFTPLTPLDPISDFPALPSFHHANQPLAGEPIDEQEKPFDACRRLSCPVDFISPFKAFEPFGAPEAAPHTASAATFFVHQQQQAPLQSRPKSSDWQSMLPPVVATEQHQQSRRHSTVPMQIVQQQTTQMPFTTPLQPICTDSWQMPKGSGAAGFPIQPIPQGTSMPTWQAPSVIAAAHGRRGSTSASRWQLDAIAEQGFSGLNKDGTCQQAPNDGAGAPSAVDGRRGSVARKVRSQANFFAPYPSGVPNHRASSTGSLLDYEGF